MLFIVNGYDKFFARKGKRMKQLEELEQKILAIIHRNNELSKAVESLNEENKVLRSKTEQLETALLKKNDSVISLENEKNSMKNSIKRLLGDIESLEKAQ